MDPQAVLAADRDLVSADLTPEAEAARQNLALSLIGDIRHRASAVFLGRDDYEKLQKFPSFLIGLLHMEALPRFVAQNGGHVALALQFGGNEPGPAIQHQVTWNGQDGHFVVFGYVFIWLPEERVVVSVESAEHTPQPCLPLTICSNRDPSAFLDLWKTFTQAHNYLRGRAFFADGEIIARQRAYGWDDIVLAEEVKRTIRTHIGGFLRNRGRLKALGVKPRRGLILEGPPGTGKTLLGKVLADTLDDVSFIWVSPRHIKNPADFDDILQVARFVAPTVLFFEDLDLFGEDRDGHGGMALGELMNQLDGAVDNEDIVTIATTNRLEVVEKALRNRPGRFDRVLTLDEMDAPCRRRMLARLLAKADVSDEDMAFLVSATKGYTGAQMTELANTLFILAVERNEGASGNGDGKADGISIGRPLIAAALDEFRVELKARVGFHAD